MRLHPPTPFIGTTRAIRFPLRNLKLKHKVRFPGFVMTIRRILFLASCVCGGVAGKAMDIGGCVALPEEEMVLLRNASTRLDAFLDDNLVRGREHLQKVLSGLGVDDGRLGKATSGETPLLSLFVGVVELQLTLHQELKRSIYDIRRALLAAAPDGPLSSADLGPKKESGVSPFVGSQWGDYRATDFKARPTDCSEVLVSGKTESGVYRIYPFKCQCSPPVEVFCDMETDGGGWTVFLSRQNVSKPINFTRNWEEYKQGFGIPGQEHWMGNEALYTLTSARHYIMRLDAQDGRGRQIWGEWNTFKVDSEEQKYRINSLTPNSKNTASDLFTSYVNGLYFSTFDRDYDKHAKTNCADTHRGGWWYKACYSFHPTGVQGVEDSTGLRISPWSKTDSKLRYARSLQLKIRPQVCSRTISVARVNTHNCKFS